MTVPFVLPLPLRIGIRHRNTAPTTLGGLLPFLPKHPSKQRILRKLCCSGRGFDHQQKYCLRKSSSLSLERLRTLIPRFMESAPINEDGVGEYSPIQDLTTNYQT